MDLYAFDDEAVWYAPDIGDNRDKKEENRFAVLLSPMSRQQYRRAEEKHSAVSVSKKGKINTSRSWNKQKVSIVSTRVSEVVNCTLRIKKTVDGKRVDEKRLITDGEDLARYASDEIMEDITDAIKDQSVLDEGLLGKSAPPSDIST